MSPIKHTILAVLSLLPSLALSQDAVTQKGRIEISGHVPAKCWVHLNGTRAAALALTDATRETTIHLTSTCNRSAAHKLRVDYPTQGSNGALTSQENSASVPFTLKRNDSALPSGSEITASGQEHNEQITLQFHPTPQTPKGKYRGQIVVTLSDA